MGALARSPATRSRDLLIPRNLAILRNLAIPPSRGTPPSPDTPRSLAIRSLARLNPGTRRPSRALRSGTTSGRKPRTSGPRWVEPSARSGAPSMRSRRAQSAASASGHRCSFYGPTARGTLRRSRRSGAVSTTALFRTAGRSGSRAMPCPSAASRSLDAMRGVRARECPKSALSRYEVNGASRRASRRLDRFPSWRSRRPCREARPAKSGKLAQGTCR